MSSIKYLVLLCGLAACGRQVVEFRDLVDAAAYDAAKADAALHDGTLLDGGLADSSLLDATLIDGTLIDGMMPDAPLADSSMVDGLAVDGPLAIDGMLAVDGPMLDAGIMVDGPMLDAGIMVDSLQVDSLQVDSLQVDGALVDGNSACALSPVVLGGAGNFAVLAGSTVTNTGPTMVMGDLGVSPGTAVTGFPPGTLIGATHAGDPTAATAIGDLTTAYNDAAGRSLCPVAVAGNLGGMTLPPGLYKSTSSLAISSGDLTLDAQGDGNAVWIFQMAATLTTTGGRQVLLINGATAANVFWQVGTSATLGTTSVMFGTIMADQAITLNTGAVLNGRALARIAAVALDSNTIVKQ